MTKAAIIEEIKVAKAKAKKALEAHKAKDENLYNTVMDRMNGAVEDMETIDEKVIELLNVKTAGEFVNAYYTMLNRKYAANNKIDRSVANAITKML